jgi:hypothetical protein
MYSFGVNQAVSGYRIAYRPAQVNHCPGCGHTHWLVGRTTAECAHCATALPIVAGAASGMGRIAASGHPNRAPLAA